MLKASWQTLVCTLWLLAACFSLGSRALQDTVVAVPADPVLAFDGSAVAAAQAALDERIAASLSSSSESSETMLLETDIELFVAEGELADVNAQAEAHADADAERGDKTSEKEDLTSAKKTATPKPTADGAWKKISATARGPHAKMIAALHRAAGAALTKLNEHVTGPARFSKCAKLGEVEVKVHMGFEFKFTCEAPLQGQPARQLWMNVWDHFGHVDVLDLRDRTESDAAEAPSEVKGPWYYDETHPKNPK